MRIPLFIFMLGLIALTSQVDAQIKLYNHGGIAIGDTTDPGSEKTVFYDDVEFTGDVTGISNIDAENTVNVDKKTFNIASTGWWQVAETNGGDHGMAIINVMDYTSSTHSSAKYLVTFQHGQGQIVQLIGDTYSTHGIVGVRLMYNTSDRVYGGARFEINVNRTGNFYVSIEDYNTTYSYSEWVLLSSAEQEVGWTLLRQLGDPANNAFATSGNIDVTGNIKATGSITASSKSYFDSDIEVENQVYVTNGTYHTMIGPETMAFTRGSSNYITAAAGGTISLITNGLGNSTSNAMMYLGTTSAYLRYGSSSPANRLKTTSGGVEITGNVELLDNTGGVNFGDATKGMKMYSDGTYLRLNKGAATAALPFLLEQPISYLYSDNLYLGWSSGDNIHFRANTVTATNWGITSSGNATFNSLSGLNVNGSSTLDAVTADGTGRFNAGLTAYQYLTIYGTFNNMSDERLKTDIKDLSAGSLEKITNLRGVTYKFINDEANNSVTGFVAQDIQKVFPELVSEQEDGLAIKTLEIIPHLVEAIKEQQEIIENLEVRIKLLEEK